MSPDFLRYVSHAPYNVDDAPLELGDGLQRQLAEVGRLRPRPLQQESQGSHCRDLDEGETRLLELSWFEEEQRRITLYRDRLKSFS